MMSVGRGGRRLFLSGMLCGLECEENSGDWGTAACEGGGGV